MLRVFEKAESDLRRNREEYEKANEKTLAEFNKTVKKEVDRLSKAGKPEEALALKDSAEAWFQQAVGASAPDGVTQMPRNAEDKRKNPNGRFELVTVKPTAIQGHFAIQEDLEGQRPIINGQPTTAPFIYMPAPAQNSWDIPEGKKVFRCYAYFIAPAPPADHTVALEVSVDGKVVGRTAPLSVDNRVCPVVIQIPRGAKTMTLRADPITHHHWDQLCILDPCFYDR